MDVIHTSHGCPVKLQLSGRAAVTAIFAETPIKPLLQSSTCLVHVHGPCPFAWKEEVLNYGLFDVTFDHTICTRDDPLIEDRVFDLWSN